MPTERQSQFGIAGGFLFFTVLGLASPFFSLLASELGASTVAIGAMVTLRAVLPIFIAMPAGQLIDTIGPVRMLRAGVLSLLASVLLVAVAVDLWLLALSQVFLGAGIVIGASSLQVLVAQGDTARRNENIKRYAMWMSCGSAVGPLLGGAIVTPFADPATGYRAAFLVSAAVTAGFLIVLMRLRPAGATALPDGIRATLVQSLTPGGILGSYRSGAALTRHPQVQFGLTATFVIMYIQSMYGSFLPLFMDEVGFATLVIAFTLAAQNLAGMASRFVLGWFMDRARPQTILIAAGAVAAAGVMLTPLASHHTLTMVLVVTVIGGAVGLNLPVSIMVMVEAVGEGERGRLMGLRLLVNRVAQLISPIVFGAVGGVLGLSTGFTAAGLLLTATIVGFGVNRRRPEAGDAIARPDDDAPPAAMARS